MHQNKINKITADFVNTKIEKSYWVYVIKEFRNKLLFMYLSIIGIYILLSIYDSTYLSLKEGMALYLTRIFTVMIVVVNIYYLIKQKTKQYMNWVYFFTFVSTFMPFVYSHTITEHVNIDYSFDVSITILTLYAVIRGVLLLIPFKLFILSTVVQNIAFFWDYTHHGLELHSHSSEEMVYFFVLSFVIFVSYNFSVLLRRSFYDRYILLANVKKANTKLDELNRIERSFLAETTAGVIAHEIKNSIAVISTYAQMLIGVKKITDTEKTAIKKIYDMSLKSDEYIKNIRSMTVGKLNIKKHNVKDIIDEASYLWQSSSERYNPTINMNIENSVFKTDSALLQGAISNVIRNAIEVKKNSKIDINAFVKKDNLHIEIINDKKIPKQNLKDMFVAMKNNKDKKGSTGIGLVFSKSVAEKLNGQLKLKTTNNKTVFTFILPLG